MKNNYSKSKCCVCNKLKATESMYLWRYPINSYPEGQLICFACHLHITGGQLCLTLI